MTGFVFQSLGDVKEWLLVLALPAAGAVVVTLLVLVPDLALMLLVLGLIKLAAAALLVIGLSALC